MTVKLARFEMATADDRSGLERALASLGGKEIAKAALLIKAPGDYTDGSREKARAAAEGGLTAHGLAGRAEMVTVIGSEGFSGTFGYALADDGKPGGGSARRLAIGLARGTPPADEEIDRPGFVAPVADLVRKAMRDGGLAAADVAHVVINTPAPTKGDAGLRGRRARAIASLAAGVAIGEIDQGAIKDEAILRDWGLFTRHTQSFTGPTVKQVEVIVIGNRAGAGGRLVAVSTVAEDTASVRALKSMLLDAGLKLDATGELADPQRVAAMIYKSGVRTDGMIQGVRTQVFNGQIPPEKHVRAAQSGLLAALLGTPLMFNTFDPVHQCPEGGAVACAIVDVGED